MTDKTNMLGRVERAVKQNITTDTVVIGVIDGGFVSQRDGYWERRYWVAWGNTSESGTHAVNVSSDDEEALFWGHYQFNREEALADMLTRAGVQS